MERAFWASAVTATVVGASGLRSRSHQDAAIDPPLVLPSWQVTRPTTDSLLDAVGTAREGDLFRRERTPVEANPASQPSAMTGPTMSTRPPLVLRGLVGGPALEAIVEGIPGVEGAVVLQTGQTMGGITLRAVRRDTAILVNRDTTWKLTVRRLW
jgi:hypothetical protein